MLLAQSKPRGNAPALRSRGQEISYAHLAEQSVAMAAALQAQGIQRGDHIAWLGLNHPLQIALLFACAGMGAIAMPLNYRLAAPELERILRDGQPRLLIHDAAWQELAEGLKRSCAVPLRSFQGLLDDGLKLPAANMSAGQANDAALLVYTSGTTGLPKGAVHTQNNLCRNMAIAGKNAALDATDLIATVLPLFHVGGLCIQTLPALAAGACVSLHERFDAGAALKSFALERPTLTLQVPATMRALIEHADWASTDLSSLRAVWAGSSVLPANLIEAFHARGIPVCNVYGSTETGPFSISLPPAHARTHVGSCGWPASDDVHVKLLDAQQGVGEICIRAPNVAERYWPDIALKDEEGWFHTGDLARQAEDGSYWVVGRAKDMLISGGENIYPAEIENLLAAQPGVIECAVVGVPDSKWGEVVAACVVLATNETQEKAQQALSTALNSQLARYKLPRQWHFMSTLPKTALGKVQKAQLLADLSRSQES
ncbi:AMP-binding protein [Variovorax sp. PCZ-1]|nr:AMP-binding protein [Variovorax sp. PCZ-1]